VKVTSSNPAPPDNIKISLTKTAAKDTMWPHFTNPTQEGCQVSERNVISNQKQILKNQKTILSNQSQIKANQETIKKNQASILKNQADLHTIIKNQEQILSRLKK
jgi:hypothetical protein